MRLKNKALLVMGALGLAVLSWFASTRTASDETRLTSSTYSTGPKGAKALYLVLEELGVNVWRWRRSFSSLDSLRGTLVIYDPQALGIGKRETAKLRSWVSAGNRLVLVPGTGGFTAGRTERSCVADGLGRTLRGFGIRVRHLTDAGRSNLSVKLPNFPVPFHVSVGRSMRWNKPDKRWNVLAEDSAGPILVTRKIGKGHVIALSDPTIFSNQHIRGEQNLRFSLALLLGHKQSSRIVFDEYHHGHTMEENFWAYVGSSVFSWILIQTALGLGLFFYSGRASHAGRFRSLEQPKGRSSMEYIQSMASVLESHMPQTAALEAILTRFVGQVSRRLGAPPGMLEHGGRAGGAHPMGPVDESKKIIRECQNVIRSGRDSQAVLYLARRLADTRRHIMHAARMP
jgi:hypothetical protein